MRRGPNLFNREISGVFGEILARLLKRVKDGRGERRNVR
jgi:hypothetical protein